MVGTEPGHAKDPSERPPGLRERFTSFAHTLRVRIMGLVAVSVVIPAVLTGWMANTFLNRDLQRELHASSKVRRDRLAAQLNTWFADLTNRVKAATTSSYLFSEQVAVLARGSRSVEAAKAQADVDRYLSYLVEDNPNFQGFAILSESGSPLAVQPPSIRGLLEGLKPGGATGETSFVEVDSADGKKVFILQRVAAPEQGRTVFLGGLLRTEALVKMLTEGVAEGGVAYLVDTKGAVRHATLPGATSMSLPAGARGLLEGGTDVMTYRGLLHGEVIGSATRIDVLDWRLVSEMSRREAYRNISLFKRYIPFLTLIIAGLLLFPALLVAQTIVVPLEELSRAARKIHSGEYGVQVKPTAGGELGEFINAFNAMSQQQLKTLEELRAATQQLAVLSITDPLTGRANRRFMEEQLERSIKVAQRKGAPLSLLMLDLDHFKQYNDAHGHLGGDEALKQVGDLLAASVRDTDYVSRFGGEEFLISLEGASKENAVKVAEKIRSAIEEREFVIGDVKTRITASLGVASYPEDGEASKTLQEAADRALYKAKSQGRNRVCSA